jgi:hypothetical protein
MSIFNHQKRCDAAVEFPKVSDLIKTWLQPGAISNETGEPFQRLAAESKTFETVWASPSGNTGLKPGVDEKAP